MKIIKKKNFISRRRTSGYKDINMELLHIVDRGVDRRNIFLDNQDYFRFIHDMFEFNDEDSVESISKIFNKFPDVGRREIKNKPRKLLVDIFAFCLMPNHYHLFLSPKIPNGTSLFMKKINGGYAKYFNTKYKRDGALFQGKYKRILIKNEAHFIHLPYYIHFNPLDLTAPEWRERKLKDFKKAMEFLNKYRWSSHLDYSNNKNFPSIIDQEFLLDFFGGHNGYKKGIEEWLKSLYFNEIKNIVLE